MKAITPGSMLGGFGRCIGRDPTRSRKRTGARRRRSKDSPSRLRFRPQRRLTFRSRPLAEPPRTALRCCFDLLPLRARRRCQSTDPWGAFKRDTARKVRTLRILNNQHFHSALCNLWITPRRAGRGWDARTPDLCQLDITHVIVRSGRGTARTRRSWDSATHDLLTRQPPE